MTDEDAKRPDGRGWVDAVQQPNLAAGGNGGGGTYGGITYTIVGAGGGTGGGCVPLADPPEQQMPSTPTAIAVFVLVAVLTWAALQWL